MDVDLLLQDREEDAPSGEDLEYDPGFTELEIAAQPGEERQAGEEILAAEEPDYKEVSALALAVLGRSHDLRAAVYLAEAQLRLSGFPGFAEVTSYIRQCLERHWDTCHPQLDADDDNDPTMRVNAVLALADGNRILRGIRKAPLTQSRTFGAISLRDIAVAEGEIVATEDMEEVHDNSSVGAAFQDTDEAVLRAIAAAVSGALEDVEAISAKFDAEVPGQGPDLDPLVKLLRQAKARMTAAIGEPEEAETATEEAEDAPATRSSGGGGGGGGGGGVNNRTDVLNAIDRIIAYYARSEPSSPVPILLNRAKKLVNADFMTIMKNLAPDGVENVNVIGGFTEEEDD